MTRKSIEFYCDAYDKFQKLRHNTGVREMAEILGVDPTTISQWRRGRTPYSQYSQTHRTTLNQAKHMLDEGYTYAAPARFLSVNPKTLRKHFPGMGHPGKKMEVGETEFSLDAYV